MKRKNFTMIPNALLSESQLSVPARYLLCVLHKYSFQKDYCWPGQETLGKDLGYSARHIRNLLNELLKSGVVVSERCGWNRTNTYKLSKNLQSTRVASSNESNGKSCQKQTSAHLGTVIPIHQGNPLPIKNTYGSRKENNGSSKGLESLRQAMVDIGLKPNSQIRLEKADF